MDEAEWKRQWSELNSELEDYWDEDIKWLPFQIEITHDEMDVLIKISKSLNGGATPANVVAFLLLRKALQAWRSGEFRPDLSF